MSFLINVKKLEKDCNIHAQKLKVREPSSTYHKVEDMEEIVCNLPKNDVDILVLHGGDEEISEIKVNEAIIDTTKDIDEQKENWFKKVEQTSKRIFQLAENSVKMNSNMQAVIVKHLPRFDKGADDILNVKPSLSAYANTIYDQCLLKAKNPQNIKLIEVDLKVENNGFLKDLIYGKQNSDTFDGVHLRGSGAERHFNYRVKQAIQPIIKGLSLSQSQSKQSISYESRRLVTNVNATGPALQSRGEGKNFLGQKN